MNHAHLEFLFDHYSHSNGWLSHIGSMINLPVEDEAYLHSLADHKDNYEVKIGEWMRRIHREGGLQIYNEEDLGKKLSLLNTIINDIEMMAEGLSQDEAMLYLLLSNVESLSGLRYKLRNQILNVEIPDRKEAVSDSDIERARAVPLSSLIPKLPKSKKIACPFHAETTPSFHVGQWGYCFGCRTYCDAIGWLIRQEGHSFISAVKRLVGLG